MPRESADSEEVLVVRARSGDRLAFEELVRRHADRLYAVVLRFLADSHEAEEVTQEAFLRAWRSIGKFKGESQFFTWLYRIGLNEAKRRMSRASSGAPAVSDDQPQAEPVDWRDAPEARATEGELRAVLEDAVRALDLDYRTPLVLRDIEGLSTREAASVMGLSEAAFKSRLHRARMKVRKAIDQYLEDEQ